MMGLHRFAGAAGNRRWLCAWIAAATLCSVAAPAPGPGFIEERARQHWCWQPVQAPAVPAVADPSWPAGDIDRFLLAGLESHGLRPGADADRRTLLRRATFDLTGLPPTAREIDAFLADTSPGAFARVVDRLLASPHFGERWARHWMDRVRYAETLGHEFDYAIVGAWRYRDFLIRALNDDVPYDQLVREHVAGDLLPSPRVRPPGVNESAIGTAFYWLGQGAHSPVDVKQWESDTMENQIDVLSKTFQGLTVACSRCHDHKFDAIGTADYYGLYGVLASSRYVQRVANAEEIRPRALELLERKSRLRALAARDLEAVVRGATDTSSWRATGTAPVPGSLDLARWYRHGPATEIAGGDFLLGTNAAHPIASIIPPGALHTARASVRLQGDAQSPTFTVTNRYLLVRAWGRETRVRVVVDNFTLIRNPIYGGLKRIVHSTNPEWLVFDLETWKGHRAYVELVDTTAPDPADEQRTGASYSPSGFGAIDAVVPSDSATPPAAGAMVAISRERALAAIQAWAEGGFTAENAAVLNAILPGLPGSPALETTAAWEACVAAEGALPASQLVAGMADGNGFDEHVFRRGSHRATGDLAPRRFLAALTLSEGRSSACTEGESGRAEVARRMTDPRNPLTARVYVNYLWHHLFGRGLVATVDNFGVLGERPTHPALLDHLASRLLSHGWSTKRMIREVMLSRAYRMSSHPDDPAAERADPLNAWWHRAEVRRLEGEAIRDAMLAVSGRLRPELYGEPVPVHLTPFMEGRGRPATSGPLDGDGRRTLYTEVRRNFLPPMLLAFDFPIPATTTGRRSVSNVPAQGLTLLNDPFVLDMARRWAERALRETAAASDERRIAALYVQAFGRPPTAAESESAREFLADAGGSQAVDRYAALCHVLFNVKEFVFVD
jgi:hypothetical protein